MEFENIGVGFIRSDKSATDNLIVRTPITTTTDTASADALALTAAPGPWVDGFIIGTPTAAMTLTTPTAAQFINQFGNGLLRVGDSFEFLIRNQSLSAVNITLAAGTNVTLAASNTNTIAQAYTRQFLAVVTAVGGAPALTIYTLGAATH